MRGRAALMEGWPVGLCGRRDGVDTVGFSGRVFHAHRCLRRAPARHVPIHRRSNLVSVLIELTALPGWALAGGCLGSAGWGLADRHTGRFPVGGPPAILHRVVAPWPRTRDRPPWVLRRRRQKIDIPASPLLAVLPTSAGPVPTGGRGCLSATCARGGPYNREIVTNLRSATPRRHHGDRHGR